MTLEDLIRQATTGGRFAGLTLWPTAGGEFQAGLKDRASQGWRCEIDADPVVALRRVLGDVSGMTTDEGVFG